MNRDKKTRYLKIQTRKLKSSWLIEGKKVPEIRISGIWLAREGFFPKDKIKVEIRKEFLGIELQPRLA
ncbi:MAG: type I toxin-antitoxin system SymE family toxin [bacterium]|nr:type I toxin-antitoxin system SymE family toxin [bacterium]